MQRRKPGETQGHRAVACFAAFVCLLFCTDGLLRAGDNDNDHLDDDWEVQYGLDPQDPADALADLDQDGHTNLGEYLHGSIPNDSTSIPTTHVTITVPVQVSSIQAAVDLSIHGDTVVVSPGVYQEAVDFSGREIRLKSTDPSDSATVNATIIAPNSNLPAVKFNSGESSDALIEGFTLTGAQYGVGCYGDASPTISRCVIAANDTYGVYVRGVDHAVVHIDQCRIIENGGQGCAGIFCRYSALDLTNTLVAGNGAARGTAIHLEYGTAGLSQITNCTIADHTYRGIRCYKTGTQMPHITNCILWNNEDDLVDCTATYSCIEDGDAGLGNIRLFPGFRNPATGDFSLLNESPCIDAGAPWADYSSEPGPNGRRINIGLYGGTAQATTSTDADQDGLSDHWETHYWPQDDPAAHDPGDDPDQDGFNNMAEYLYGYDPTVPTDAEHSIVHAEVVPAQFNPTEGEVVSIHCWTNRDGTVRAQLVPQAEPDRIIHLPDQQTSSGQAQSPWDGTGTTGLIAKRGLYDVMLSLDDGVGQSVTKSLASAVQLDYPHRIDAAFCNPQRIRPLNNEVTKVTYQTAIDQDVVINLRDSTGQLLKSYPLAGSQSNELVLHGADGPADDPGSRYLSNDQDYTVEIAYEGMEETKEVLDTRAKKRESQALELDSIGLSVYMYSRGPSGYHYYSRYDASTRTVVTIGYYGSLPIDNPAERWTAPGPSLAGLREKIKQYHDNDPNSIDLAAKQAWLDILESGGPGQFYDELGWPPGYEPTDAELKALVALMSDKYLPDWGLEEGAGWVNTDAVAEDGDPVFLSNGEFSLTVTDVGFSGRVLPVSVVRTYGSRRQYNGRFGYGWDMNYNKKVRRLIDPDVVVYLDGQGNKRQYHRTETDPNVFRRDEDLNAYFHDSGESLSLITKVGLMYDFDPNGNLACIRDENGNALSFRYDSRGLLPITGFSGGFHTEEFDGPANRVGTVALEYQLAEIVDDLGRSTTLVYNDHGLLETLTDFANRTWTYTYDPLSNDLLTVQDPNGQVTTYTYGSRHNLIEITDPNGQVYTSNGYDFADRVTSQDYGDGTFTFSYHDDTQEVTVIDREGEMRTVQLNAQGQIVKDSVYTADPLAEPNAFTMTHAFNPHANITRTQWPAGNCVDYAYDRLGNVTAVYRKASASDPNDPDDPNVLGTCLTYDPNHSYKPKTITDPEGHVTTFEYDVAGNLTRMTAPTVDEQTPIVQYTYNEYGQMETRTGPDGIVTKYVYYDDPADPNNDGRLWQVIADYGTDPNYFNITSSFAYDHIGRLIEAIDPNGHATRFEYDDMDQLVKTVDADNHASLFGYNNNKKLAWASTQIDGIDQVTRYTYDLLDHVKTVIGPLGGVTERTYTRNEDPNGLIDAEGHLTQTAYNERGLVQKTIDANAGEIQYAYDDNGNLIRIEDALGNVTQYKYDKFDTLIRTTQEDDTYEELFYNRNNRVTRRINRAGQTTDYYYDALGRMTLKAPPSDPNIEFTYDIAGRLTDVNDGGDTTRYQYDRLGRVASVTDANDRIIAYEYDNRGLRTKTTYPGVSVQQDRPRRPGRGHAPPKVKKPKTGKDIRHDKGPGKGKKPPKKEKPERGERQEEHERSRRGMKPGRPKRFRGRPCDQDSEALGIVYDYDALGRVRRISTDANETLAEYSYDALSRRIGLVLGNGSTASYTYDLANRLTSLTHDIGAVEALTFEYAKYDKVGNRLSGRTNDDPTRIYTYDNQYQLTLVDYNDGRTTAYSYDKMGNRTCVDDGTVTGYQTNTLNQYTALGDTEFQYDANGNLTGFAGHTYYAYDCENRLTDVFDENGTPVASYQYDYLGRRIQKTVYGDEPAITKYAYDGDQVIAEYDGSDTLLRQFVYGPGIDEPICMIDGTQENAVYYYHLDGLGSVAALSDVNNVIVEQYSYSVFGEPSQTSALGNPYLFTGRRFDTETSLYHYRARTYAYDLGRFLQTDPIGYADGINWYSYCGNNPTNLVDPYGLCKGGGSWSTTLNAAQGVLDVGGMWPAVGIIPDALNTAISALRGNWGDAAFNAAAMVPVFGQGSTAAKWAKRGAKHADEAISVGRRGKTVLGKYPRYVDLADEIGAKRFNVPTEVWGKMTELEQWTANRKFLDRMIQRGDEIILSNPVKNIEDVSGAFRQEIDYLIDQGFRLSDNGTRMTR